jgi:cation transport ATPase
MKQLEAAVATAQGSRGATQQRVDEFAAYFTPLVVAAAVCMAVIPP